MCTTSALQDTITTDKLKVARVRFHQGTDESPLNPQQQTCESRVAAGEEHACAVLLVRYNFEHTNKEERLQRRVVRSLC